MKKNIVKWVENKYKNTDTHKYWFQRKRYCGNGNWLYTINSIYKDIHGAETIGTIHIFISKNQNDLLYRLRGLYIDSESNNGVALPYFHIDYYVWNTETEYKEIR